MVEQRDGVSSNYLGDYKTNEEIELDFYGAVNGYLRPEGGPFLIDGHVYRGDARPENRKHEEDAVVRHLTGIDGQVQTGVVLVNVYVPNKRGAGAYSIKDAHRCTRVSRALVDMLKSIRLDGYYIISDRTVSSEEDHGATRVTLRLKYRYDALRDRK